MKRTVSRRSFLTSTAALGGVTLLGLTRKSRAADDFPGFLIGIQSYSLRGFSVDDAVQTAHHLGFQSVEMFEAHFSVGSTPEQIKERVSACESLALPILGHGVNGFSADHEANERVFKFAKAAGIRNLSADPSPDSFDSLDKLVEQYDVRIAIHNHGPNHRYNKILDVVNAVRDHHPHVGACADLGHYIRSGEDPVEAIRLLGDRLFGVHLKDFAEQQDQTHGVILGQGHLPVDQVFQALKQAGFPYDGSLSLEYEEKPEDPIDDIRECLQVAQAAAERALS